MKCLKMAVGSIDFPFLADEILISSIDVRAQMTTVNELNNGGSAVFHTFYAYDPGAPDHRRPGPRLFGRRAAINSPDAGITSFTYDLADNLTVKPTANLRTASQQVTLAYQFNRVTATYTYPAPGSAHPHSPTAIGEFNLTTDANRWRNGRRDRGLHYNFRR